MSHLPLITERLVIRPFGADDLEAIHRILDEAFEVEPAPGPAALEERRSWLQWSILSQEWLPKLYQPPYGDLAIALASGELIGSIGYVPCLAPFEQIAALSSTRRPNPTACYTPEVGLFWAIDPRHQGRGYATEAARALVQHGFNQLRLNRIVATTEYDNLASQRVMANIGMQLEHNPFSEPPWMQVVGILYSPHRCIDG